MVLRIADIAMHRLAIALVDIRMIYLGIAILLIGALLYGVLSKPRKPKIFPGWAAIELALASYVVCKGGLSLWI